MLMLEDAFFYKRDAYTTRDRTNHSFKSFHRNENSSSVSLVLLFYIFFPGKENYRNCYTYVLFQNANTPRMRTPTKKCLLQMSQSDYDQLNQLSGPESFDDVSNNDDIDGTNSEDGRSQNRGWGNKVKGVLHHLGRNEIGDCCVSQSGHTFNSS